MNLIEEILAISLDSNISIVNILRKLKILASILKNKKLAHWVDNELNGYTKKDDVPDYRKFTVQSKGVFRNIFYQNTTYIPPVSIPDEFKDLISHAIIIDSIATIEDLLKNDEPTYQIPWPANFIALMQTENEMDTYVLLSAWQEITRGSFIGLTNVVRTKIMDFVLALQEEAPEVKSFTITSGSTPSQQEIASQVYNTYIIAPVNNVAVGSKNFTQSNDFSKVKGNIDELMKQLKQIGLDDSHLTDLEIAIKKDGRIRNKSIGDNVNIWISKIFQFASKGLLYIGLDIASAVVLELIKSYYGI